MKAIAAMSENRVIGNKGKLPWRLPGDLKFFKKMTEGCLCVVGRKTLEYLPKLPNRKFVLVSNTVRDGKLINPDVIDTYRGESGMPFGDQSWVIGGAQIYNLFLPVCTDLYLTHVKGTYEGDVFFPPFEHLFDESQVMAETEEYTIKRYTRKKR